MAKDKNIWYKDHLIKVFPDADKKLFTYITTFEYDHFEPMFPFESEQEAISDAKAQIDYGIEQQEIDNNV